MNYSNATEETCDHLLSDSWVYPIVGWFVFSFLLTGFSLLYTAIEAKKKHTEIDEAYEEHESDEDEYGFSDEEEGSDLSSLYEVMPEEYRNKIPRKRSKMNSLDQIREDEEEEEDDEEEVDDQEIKSEQSSDESEVSADQSRFSKYRGSLSGKGSKVPSSPSVSTISSIASDPPRISISSKGSQNLSSSSRQSSVSNSNPEYLTSISEISESRNLRTSLKVPFVKSRNSLARSESKNRADFLLKMMANGGDIKNYRIESPGVQKRSPTGRKISMDVKPRIVPRDSIALVTVNKKPKFVEKQRSEKQSSHIYVNLPDINNSNSEYDKHFQQEETPDPSDSINITEQSSELPVLLHYEDPIEDKTTNL